MGHPGHVQNDPSPATDQSLASRCPQIRGPAPRRTGCNADGRQALLLVLARRATNGSGWEDPGTVAAPGAVSPGPQPGTGPVRSQPGLRAKGRPAREGAARGSWRPSSGPPGRRSCGLPGAAGARCRRTSCSLDGLAPLGTVQGYQSRSRDWRMLHQERTASREWGGATQDRAGSTHTVEALGVPVRRGRLGFAGPLRGGSAGPGPGSWDAGCAALTGQPSGCGSPDQLPQAGFDRSHLCRCYDSETPSGPGS